MKKKRAIDNTKAGDWYEEGPDGKPLPYCIIRAEPMREATLTLHCLEAGIPTFNPQVRKQEPKPGRKTITRLRSLFPGYVFALLGNGEMRFDERYRVIRQLPGFLGFLHTGDKQSPIAQVSGEALTALTEQEYNLSTRDKRGWSPFSVGQDVRFVDGPFAGLLARITSIEPNKRIGVLREMFGRETPFKVNAHEIEAA